MKKAMVFFAGMSMSIFFTACTSVGSNPDDDVIKPKFITQPVKYDTDDPAIWVNEDDPAKSLIIGTDKNEDGALYVFDLNGRIIEDKTVRGLKRPNNVDIEELEFANGDEIHIAVTTERLTNKIRIFSVPDMNAIDNGGIEVFVGEKERAPMGVSLYKRNEDDAIFVIVSRKTGPSENYLWQYLLIGNEDGSVSAELVRTFGKFSGAREIEAIAVDDELGYLYYSDEGVGIRKYYANPDQGDEQLTVFGMEGFANDHEGISIYPTDIGKGYIIVSDQQANKFHFFDRAGTLTDPHDHRLVKTILASTNESDGSEVTNASLGDLFPRGLFVAMSDDKTFHLYAWEDLAGDDLIIAPDGIPEHTKEAIKPKYISEKVVNDTDDPAIWINKEDPQKSLIIGTDKEVGGGLYAFDLEGKIQNKVLGLGRPNNVDIAYGLKISGKEVDIAVTTERANDQVRIFTVPELQPIDKGGIAVFEDEEEKGPMGVALYTSPKGLIYAIVGRKDGPADNYLWQYRIDDAGDGNVRLTKVREFGQYSGVKEIEAIAVDNELGYVYYSDEMHGIRKYYADPDKGNEELAVFGQKDFGRDIEGISIYKSEGGKGYILVSDQQVGTFNVYPREGTTAGSHDHVLIKAVELSTLESDGSDVTSVNLGADFPSGLFVAMSTDKTFHLYDWRDILSKLSQ